MAQSASWHSTTGLKVASPRRKAPEFVIAGGCIFLPTQFDHPASFSFHRSNRTTSFGDGSFRISGAEHKQYENF
jgi:hypothetical protein